MGGKVALEFIQQTVAGMADGMQPPRESWILDSQPGKIASDMVPDVNRVLDAVKVGRCTICHTGCLRDSNFG